MECGSCQNQFVRFSDLRRHAKRFHPEAVDDLAPLKRQQKNYEFSCSCGKKFNHKKNLNAHLKTQSREVTGVIHNRDQNQHDIFTAEIQLKKCPLCLYKSQSISFEHFKISHDIDINVQKLNFKSFEDFSVWKSSKEKETKSKFVKHGGSIINTKSTKHFHYYCHRSGFFKSNSKGLRHLKVQGSNKINGFCPSKIKLLENKDGHCEVTFTETHVGHTNGDLGHLFLTNSERKSIAVKIASKIPFPSILEDIRENLSEESLNRIDLLTKKDLYNLETAYNLQSGAVRHQNDAISIEAWVNEMKEGTSCVLFYKAQDCALENYPQLKSSDFMLIIMNEGQLHILKKFCDDCICIDSTHGLNSYQFEMHTLMVLDDLRQGFPCAFFISNRSDEDVLKIFFEQIRDHIGIQIKPKVFMSDMAPGYYNAWIKVMHPPNNRLFCTWHVLRAWSKKLSLISSKDKQSEIFTKLRTLLEETDQKAFYKMIENFILKTSVDPETCEFSAYFKEYYLKNTLSWAYCHRLHSGLNTNMHLERMHGTIKYFYLNGRNIKRLDKTINTLMRFVRDKLFDRIISLHKGKVSSKLAELRSRHKTSLKLKTDIICENGEGWDIPSATKSFEIYHVQKNNINCQNCPLRCIDCQTCIHQYSCSCLDSAIKWNMCKHIHVICRFVNAKLEDLSKTDVTECQGEDNLCIHDDPKQEESKALVETLVVGSSGTAKDESVEVKEEKEEIRCKLNKLIDDIKTKDKLTAFKKLIAPIEATMLAVEQRTSSSLGIESDTRHNKIPANKKILPQRRLYTTKKRRNTQTHQRRITKISKKQRDKVAVEMLLNNNNYVCG